jgi:hypothetical protein
MFYSIKVKKFKKHAAMIHFNFVGRVRRAEGKGQRAQSTGHRAEGTEHRAQGTGHRAQSTGQRAEGIGQRAESPGQRNESSEQRAKHFNDLKVIKDLIWQRAKGREHRAKK